MESLERARKLVGAHGRTREERDDDEGVTARPRLAPGKLTTADLAALPRDAWRAIEPGKVTYADVGREILGPEAAIAYAERTRAAPDDVSTAWTFSSADLGLEAPRGIAGLDTSWIPAVLLDAAKRAPVEVDHDAFAAALRDALARGFAGGIPRAANDERAPGTETTPLVAFSALAVHALADGVRRSLSTPPGRLAARAIDGATASLDDHDDTLAAITAASDDAGELLPAELRARLERELGRPLAHVRIHTGAAANRAARSIHARAFTLGSHIYFADGELAPGTERGDQLLRHELTHVFQHDDGRLRSRSGGIEIEEHDGAAETEARAAERPAPAAKPAQESRGSGVIGRDLVDDLTSGAGKVVGKVAGKVGDMLGDIGSLAGDQLMKVVEYVSPELAKLIRNGPEGSVLEAVTKVVGELLSKMLPGNPLGALAAIGGGISDLAGVIVGAASGDTKCCETFATWCKSIGSFARKAASSQFVKNVKSAFAAIDSAVGWVVRFFGGLFVDAFRGQMQFLDTLGDWIGDALREVAKVAKKALDWALGKLGLPSVDDIGSWLEGLAEKAWKSIQAAVAKGIEVLKEIGPAILLFTGVGPMIEAFKFSMELIEVTDWLIAHRNDPNLVKNAREQMAHTFLPKLIDNTAELREKLSKAYDWVKETLGKVRDVLAKAAPYLVGLLLPLAPVLIPVGLFIKELWPKIVPVLQSLWTDIKALATKIYLFAKPVIEVFLLIGRLIAMPWTLPIVLMSVAWLMLPECFKAPILDLILDLMIAALEILPDSNVLFGPMWRFMKTGTIAFLKRVQTNWPPDQKVTVINRLARLGSGASAEAAAGFVVGFFKGVVAGVLDPFKMIYELLKIAWDVSVFFAKLINHAPQLEKVIQKHLPNLEKKAAEISKAGKQALDEFLAGKIGFDELWKLITTFMDQIDAQAASLGVTVADKLQAWFAGGGTEYAIAEAIGIAIGFIIVFALIVYFSGSAYAEAKGVIGVVAQIARILNYPYELMGAALKPLAKLFAPVIDALAALGTRLGLKGVWESAIKGFEGFVNGVGRLVEDILLAIEGKFVQRTAEELIAILGRRIGTELATKLVTELGEKAAQEVVAKLGEKTIQRLGELSADALLQLSLKLDEAIVTRMLDGGWTPKLIEKLGLALDRPALEALLAANLSAAQLERLGLLSIEKLQSQSAAGLQKLAKLPEAQFNRLNALGDDGFKRIMALPEDKFTRFVALGDQQLRVLAEMDPAKFARYAALTDTEFARFAGMAPAELQKFGALSEGAWERFAKAGDDVFLKFRGMTPEQLERFGKLSPEAFDRFAALPGPQLQKFANLGDDALRAYGELARADLLAFEKYAAMTEPQIASFGRLGEDDLMALAQLDLPTLQKISPMTKEGLQRLAALEPQAMERLAAMDLGTLQKLETLTKPAFDRMVELSAVDATAFGKLAKYDATALEAFGSLDVPTIQRFTALEPKALDNFATLDGPALKKFAALEDGQLAKFGSLKDPAMLQKFAACEPEGLAKLAKLDKSVLQKFGSWEQEYVVNISKLEMKDIEIIAELKIAPGQAAENALGGFTSETFTFPPNKFLIDRKGMQHILERHHPQYWDGSVKVPQSFLDPKMGPEEIKDAIRAVMEQNRETFLKKGARGKYQVTGTYGGKTYVLGVKNGRVGQFYPE